MGRPLERTKYDPHMLVSLLLFMHCALRQLFTIQATASCTLQSRTAWHLAESVAGV